MMGFMDVVVVAKVTLCVQIIQKQRNVFVCW